MPIEILMPALSPTMKEGNVANWMKKEGDEVKSGQIIAEIETDKAMMEIESVDNGILGKILVPAGTSNVKINTVIALVLEKGEDKAVLESYKPKIGFIHGDSMDLALNEDKKEKILENITNKIEQKNDNRIYASPLAKNIANHNNIDISKITGTGPHGRIIKKDVENYSISAENVNLRNITSFQIGRNEVEFVDEPNSIMINVIAQRLKESKQTIPHFYLSVDCNVDNLLNTRELINKLAPKCKDEKLMYKISVNDLVVKSTAMAIRKKPFINCSWVENAIRYYNNIDISIAVSIPDGLITPIIKNADQKGVLTISSEIKELAGRARKNQLKLEEFQGGGFSISNLGMYGVESFNAIVNPPQSCILAIGAVIEKPIIKNGHIIPANIMNISISVDHRAINGAKAAEFLSELKSMIENPILGIL